MKYLIFHLLLILPPVSYLLIYTLRNEVSDNLSAATGIMTLLAVIYTIPWDAYLIAEGIWYYGQNIVLIDLFGIPLGEYLFFILQTIGVSLFAYYRGFKPDVDGNIFGRIELAAPFLAISAAGLWMAAFGPDNAFYLGSILAWAGPVISLQWLYGSEMLVANKEILTKIVLIPVTYLCIVDSIAIRTGLWTIDSKTSLGTILGLPVEEAVFFLMTTTMVVQGVILYEWTFKDYSLKSLLTEKIGQL